MTTLKRIVAVFLAVLLIAATGAVAVSAADDPALSVSKDGFEYTVYQIATLNELTDSTGAKYYDGSYSFPDGVSTDVQDVVKKAQEGATDAAQGKAFRDDLDKIYNKGAGASNFGTALETVVKKGTNLTLPAKGIFYCVVTKTSATSTSANNVVIVYPKYNKKNNTWVTNIGNASNIVYLDAKATDGTDYFDKYFSEDFGKTDENKADAKLSGQGEDVDFTLEADVVGSATQNLKEFKFTDTMSKGLSYKKDTLHVYYGTKDAIDTTTAVDDQFTIDIKDAADTTKDTVFTIAAKDTTLNGAAFYNQKKVFVTYTATVNNNAVVGTEGNPNEAKLNYTNASNVKKELGPVERTVFTFNVEATKFDGSNGNKLAGAEFAIFTDKDNVEGTTIATGTSAANTGLVVFKATGDTNAYRFAPGTYYVKETKAPAGYALSTAVYKVTISDDLTAYSDANSVVNVNGNDGIKNYPVKMPETGGAGTMMFTIIGGILVLAAGAMFVIIMKKRSSSK